MSEGSATPPTGAGAVTAVAPALAPRASFPPAEERATRTPSEAQRLTWRVLCGAFAVWLLAVLGGVVAGAHWWQTATVTAPARLDIAQGIVLYRERPEASWVQARAGMPLQEGDALELADNTLASIALPGTGTLQLGPGTRIVVNALRAGRFTPTVGRVNIQQIAGTLRAVVPPTAERWPSIETPYGTAAFGSGDYLVAVQRREAQVYSRAGDAWISVGADTRALGSGERMHLALEAPPDGPLAGAPNLVRNGTFSQEFGEWQPHDVLERTPRFDRGGQREVVKVASEGGEVSALRVQRTSLLETHNETGLVQDINADVAVSPEVWLQARVLVRQANLSGGGYLGTEYPAMLRLHYRDAAGSNRTWVQGFYYANPEQRPVERGVQIARDTWTRFTIDLAQLPQRPLFVYQLEVLGAGHDFEAFITDVALVAR